MELKKRESNEPRINLTEWREDPVGDKAEDIELTNTANKKKKKKKKEDALDFIVNPVAERVVIIINPPFHFIGENTK